MSVWLIIGGVLLFLLVLLLVPIRLRASFHGELLVRIRYLFIVKQLVPEKNKKKPKKAQKVQKKAKKKAEKKEEPSFGQMLKEDGVSATLTYYKKLVSLAGTIVKKLLRVLVVDKLEVQLRIATDDPADTAVDYGKACAVVYPAQALLESIVKVKKRTVQLAPDFTREKGEAAFDVQVHVTPLRMLKAGFGFFLYIFANTVKNGQVNSTAAAE